MARIRPFPETSWVSQNSLWPTRECCLYLIEEVGGPTKIGVAGHPFRRLSCLQGGNPRWLAIKAIFIGERDDCLVIESGVLKRLAHLVVRGEWIDLPWERVIEQIQIIA